MLTLTERELIEQILRNDPAFVANNLLALQTSEEPLDRAFADEAISFIKELSTKCEKILHFVENDPFTL